MKNSKISALLVVILILVFSCTKEEPAACEEPRFTETILDKKEHIEPTLILDVPPVSRMCGCLDLTFHRISMGDGECTLYVEEEGRGMPLVLINGGPGGTHHYFHPWFSRARKWARVVYYDQRGTGLSDFIPGEKGYSVEQAVIDLDAVRQALNIDRWVVLGYSYGGFLAQYYALNYPERTAGLVLLNASPGMAVDRADDRIREFLTDKERARLREIREETTRLREENNWDRNKTMEVLIYNNILNGDWKLQHYHRPTPERAAQMALYEWVNDSGFNGIVGSSMNRIDLTGAFEDCPIPTLICEGAWDMTWNPQKAGIMHRNHPGSSLVMFADSAHQLFEDEPDKFFGELKEFVMDLRPVSQPEMKAFVQKTKEWLSSLALSPDYVLGAYGYSRSSSEKLMKEYSRDWLAALLPGMQFSDFLKVGFALYDVKNYRESLWVFEKMAAWGSDHKNLDAVGGAKIWQGHMLDLLGEREKAKSKYAEAASMKLDARWSHGQYGMEYRLSAYAEKRLRSPFQRIENGITD